MKNKSLHSFLVTALVAASACVMQAQAFCLNDEFSTITYQQFADYMTVGDSITPVFSLYCNNPTSTKNDAGDPKGWTIDDNVSDHTFFSKTVKFRYIPQSYCIEEDPITLHLANDGDLYDANTRFGNEVLRIDKVAEGYGTLTNGDEIDSKILTNLFPNKTKSPCFIANAPGSVTLTFEGDVVFEKGGWSYFSWSYLPDITRHVTVHVPVNVVE